MLQCNSRRIAMTATFMLIITALFITVIIAGHINDSDVDTDSDFEDEDFDYVN